MKIYKRKDSENIFEAAFWQDPEFKKRLDQAKQYGTKAADVVKNYKPGDIIKNYSYVGKYPFKAAIRVLGTTAPVKAALGVLGAAAVADQIGNVVSSVRQKLGYGQDKKQEPRTSYSNYVPEPAPVRKIDNYDYIETRNKKEPETPPTTKDTTKPETPPTTKDTTKPENPPTAKVATKPETPVTVQAPEAPKEKGPEIQKKEEPSTAEPKKTIERRPTPPGEKRDNLFGMTQGEWDKSKEDLSKKYAEIDKQEQQTQAAIKTKYADIRKRQGLPVKEEFCNDMLDMLYEHNTEDPSDLWVRSLILADIHGLSIDELREEIDYMGTAIDLLPLVPLAVAAVGSAPVSIPAAAAGLGLRWGAKQLAKYGGIKAAEKILPRAVGAISNVGEKLKSLPGAKTLGKAYNVFSTASDVYAVADIASKIKDAMSDKEPSKDSAAENKPQEPPKPQQPTEKPQEPPKPQQEPLQQPDKAMNVGKPEPIKPEPNKTQKPQQKIFSQKPPLPKERRSDIFGMSQGEWDKSKEDLSKKYAEIGKQEQETQAAIKAKYANIKKQPGIPSMKENYNQRTLNDLMMEVDTILEEIDNPSIIISQLNLVAERYSLTNEELVEIMNEGVPSKFIKAAPGIISDTAKKAADIVKGAETNVEKASEYMKKMFGVSPNVEKSVTRRVEGELMPRSGGTGGTPSSTHVTTGEGSGKNLVPDGGREVVPGGKKTDIVPHETTPREKEVHGTVERINKTKPEAPSEPSKPTKGSFWGTVGKAAAALSLGGTAATGVSNYMNKDGEKQPENKKPETQSTPPGATPTPSGIQKRTDAPSSGLSTHTPWKTDKSGKVAGTKLTPAEYNKHLETKFGTDVANKKIEKASGTGWKDISKKIRTPSTTQPTTPSVDTSVTNKYADMPTAKFADMPNPK